MKATARDLIGRRIVDVDFRPFACGNKTCTCASGPGRSSWHSDPVLTLDNGRRVFFVNQETDCGEYGTSVCISDKKPRAKSAGMNPAEAFARGRQIVKGEA